VAVDMLAFQKVLCIMETVSYVSNHTSEFLFSTINTGLLIMCEDDQGVPLLLMMIVENFLPPELCGCVVMYKYV